MSLFAVKSFAYNAILTNKIDSIISLRSADKLITTISPGNTVEIELDPYTAYAFSYKGQWAEQGLGTIQKYSYMVYQITPVNRASGIINIETRIQSDGQDGYVDNVNDGAGNQVFGGICFKDTGVSCKLSDGDKLKQLLISFEPINNKIK